jgi:hypothetical protein
LLHPNRNAQRCPRNPKRRSKCRFSSMYLRESESVQIANDFPRVVLNGERETVRSIRSATVSLTQMTI